MTSFLPNLSRNSLSGHRAAASLAVVLTLSFACAKPYAAEPAAFPGNEAVRIVNGKRVVELPPLSPADKDRVEDIKRTRSGLGPTPEGASGARMFETMSGTVECFSTVDAYFNNCIASTIGREKKTRTWAVKRGEHWYWCASRKPNTECELMNLKAKRGDPLHTFAIRLRPTADAVE